MHLTLSLFNTNNNLVLGSMVPLGTFDPKPFHYQEKLSCSMPSSVKTLCKTLTQLRLPLGWQFSPLGHDVAVNRSMRLAYPLLLSTTAT